MRRSLFVFGLVVLVLCGAHPAGAQSASPSPSPSAAPSAEASAAPSASASAQAAPDTSETPDPYLWLEDVNGTRAMTWVKEQNARTLGVLQADPRFPGLLRDNLALSQAKDRIPAPAFRNGRIYNFWQDATHVRGIWRSTTLADYANPAPAWTTALDLDALSASEKANWVWEGSECVWPSERRCLIHLSDGGEDAQTIREFDLGTHAFVPGGFVLPHGKQNVTWETPDALLVAREWKPGELTASGYPYVLKRLRRGAPLGSAVEVFRGTKTDISVGATVFDDEQGDHVEVIGRGVTFFTSEQYLLTPHGTVRINVPPKVQPAAVVAGHMLFNLGEAWTANGHTLPSGALAAVTLADLRAHPGNLHPVVVYAPGPRDSLGDVNTTRDRVVFTAYHNVRGRAYVATPLPNGAWQLQRLSLPDNSAVDLGEADSHGPTAFVSVTGFLTPTTLWKIDATAATATTIKALPAKFDASHDAVEQHEAISKDGTHIPYFLVHPKAMKLDGTNPTILYAYGGFLVSMTPAYSANIGKEWLGRGGVFVLANIRGGGEFGPKWHEAGLKTHRQRIYDDFAAVGGDLIARKITSPRRLGIQGGSNGGLLMGVEFTEHPDMWHAVDIQVPLLDMLRFEHIAAGASWVGEYGSVSVPAERAFLASISPYQNLRPGVNYPEPFIWTTTKDDRVGPQHARKFAAKLAELHYPYYYYEVIEGGHGSGANARERSRTTALEDTYFIRKLMDPTEPGP